MPAPAPTTPAANNREPYRLRKPVMEFPAPTSPTLADAAALIERTGAKNRVERWITTARLLEELGESSTSLTELARVTELADPAPAPEEAAQERGIAQLVVLVALTARVSARVGASAQANELRALCFDLARTCQHAHAKLRSQQLWRAP